MLSCLQPSHITRVSRKQQFEPEPLALVIFTSPCRLLFSFTNPLRVQLVASSEDNGCSHYCSFLHLRCSTVRLHHASTRSHKRQEIPLASSSSFTYQAPERPDYLAGKAIPQSVRVTQELHCSSPVPKHRLTVT
jgi:hypothetical protein